MTREEYAEKLFREGYNCAQTVFGTYHDIVGMSLQNAVKLASPMGAGFGKLREVCGAACGMTLVLGYLKGYTDSKATTEKKELYKIEQDLMNQFKETMGSYICKEMLGLKPGEDLPEPAVRDENYYKSRPCIKACRTAASLIQKTFNIPDITI